MLTVASYYKYCPDKQEGFGMSLPGLGARRWWETALGIALPKLLGNATLVGRAFNYDNSLDRIRPYQIIDIPHNITYCQPFDPPLRRPLPTFGSFVYGCIDDVEGNERQLELWLRSTKPDVLFSLHDPRPHLAELCKPYDCQVVPMGWFELEAKPYIADKIYTAVSTGAFGYPCYPQRTVIMENLQQIADEERDGILVASTNNQCRYPISTDRYQYIIGNARYYVTAGTWDVCIPAKCIEVMNAGACLVMPEAPRCADYGLVDGETYIKLHDPSDKFELSRVLGSDAWRYIAPAGQKLVQKRHMIQHRAAQILEVYAQWKESHG